MVNFWFVERDGMMYCYILKINNIIQSTDKYFEDLTF